MLGLVKRIEDRGRAVAAFANVQRTQAVGHYNENDTRELVESLHRGGLGINTPYQIKELVRAELEESGLERLVGGLLRFMLYDGLEKLLGEVLPILAAAPRKISSALDSRVPDDAYFARGLLNLVTGAPIEAETSSRIAEPKKAGARLAEDRLPE